MTNVFTTQLLPQMEYMRKYAMIFHNNNKMDADDLLQETFIRALRFSKSFTPDTNSRGWLYRIMKNIYINSYNKKKLDAINVDYEAFEGLIENIKSNTSVTLDQEEILFSNILDDEMITALNSLRDEYRITVILSDLEGMSYEEIADFLHCPRGTVRSRLHRGRNILRSKLKTYAQNKGYINV